MRLVEFLFDFSVLVATCMLDLEFKHVVSTSNARKGLSDHKLHDRGTRKAKFSPLSCSMFFPPAGLRTIYTTLSLTERF